MKKLIYMVCAFACVPFVSHASDLSDAIANTRVACGGISDEMADMKRMAGINTAVTGVGTVAGGVALGTGLAKANVDDEIGKIRKTLSELRDKETNPDEIFISDESLAQLYDEIEEDLKVREVIFRDQDPRELVQKSKTLGNIRTGTMAASSVANIAGTVIGATNRVRGDLLSQIKECTAATKVLSNVMMQARLDGNADANELLRAEKIVYACSRWETVDVSKIDNRARGATISSAIGATTGVAGTVTSAMANSGNTRKQSSISYGDYELTSYDEESIQKEKNLNTASNVLAGATTAASAVATVFNATQIGAIKNAASVADECEGALK